MGVTMELNVPEPGPVETRSADRRALLLIGGMLVASLVLGGLTARTEVVRSGSSITWQETWVNAATSHAAILLLAPLFPLLLDRFPIPGDDWLRALPGHALGLLTFSALHVSLMLAARRLLFPGLVGFPYPVNLLAPAQFLYELRKDTFTYALLLVGFVTMRSVERHRRESESALRTARRDRRLTLRTGASAVVVDAGEIGWARAAGNYVEVEVGGRTHLARMTLKRLEELLLAAGSRHLRVHRSYLVRLDAVRRVTPTGDGDVRLTLADGTVAPGSRRYRDRLLAALEGRDPDPAG